MQVELCDAHALRSGHHGKPVALVLDFVDTFDAAITVLEPAHGGKKYHQAFSRVLRCALDMGVYRTLQFICEEPKTLWFDLALEHRRPELTLEALILRQRRELHSKCYWTDDTDVVRSMIARAKLRLALFDVRAADYNLLNISEEHYIMPE